MPKINNLLLNLNFEHHIDWHYEIESHRSEWLQHMPVEEEFFEDRLNHCLKIPQDSLFQEFLLEEFGSENAEEDFDYLSTQPLQTFLNLVALTFQGVFVKQKRYADQSMRLRY